mgnify:CR=1 FL=1
MAYLLGRDVKVALTTEVDGHGISFTSTAAQLEDDATVTAGDGLVAGRDVRGAIPINVPTQGVDTNYRQVGILTRINGQETILPLMGRKTYNRSNKWVYYTATDKYNQIKLPLSHNGKNCTGEYGCDEFMDGTIINIPELNGSFTVKIYENNSLQYIPY